MEFGTEAVLNEVPLEVVDHDIAIYVSQELKDIRRQLDRHIIGRLADKASGLSFGQQQLADLLRMASAILSMFPNDCL